MTSAPYRRLVFVGAGHAHVEVLRRFAQRPLPGTELVLVTRAAHTPYSGAVPLVIAGHLSLEDALIDAAGLAARASARLILASATGLDPDARQLSLDDGTRLAFDTLSLDIGSAPDMAALGADAAAVIPAKPIDGLLARIEALAADIRDRDDPVTIAVVGSGAAGVELAFSLDHRFAGLEPRGPPVRVVLAGRSRRLVPGCNARTRRCLERRLAQRGIPHLSGFDAVSYRDDELYAADRRSVRANAVIWVTESAAPPWLAASGLACDARGFVLVDEALRSRSHPSIFAAGDVAALPQPRPKAGVFAVRAGPVLAENLRRALTGETLRAYRPQTRWLSLISTGDRHAVADRGPLSFEGEWVWRWKRWIDARFLRRYAPNDGSGSCGLRNDHIDF
ncbi:FAD-dependent oxidoreductase [Antarcticirhabdus aurantiaca]|uniref:FAD-dependent oxidoreductase n=1 Tax=Antarcticirhabdus aurantiaca TaxID=2606717 RepID=A0ACD4NHH2_9HYPH|nr:FAD-dependent oxidoreductase [Antarcticirhabdus aurantiaca]WAJ26268.1 FAD-dependent oxidoreductase [Jeongeuplla avenae]